MMRDERGCVLVVDDEPDMLEVTVLLLENCGYRALTARNGAQALEMMRQTRPCVVLLDLMMPVMDGWRFREEQLREAALADVPVVVITGAGVAASRTELFAGAVAFLEKPVAMDLLLKVVAEHC
ncbi:MAG TPA: response regulator [Anaeromyxobacteraceae bacterium]|nr:response regulator [Anaeromyxobacteraceae bacterium]